MADSAFIVVAVAVVIGFAAIWYLMDLVSSRFSTGGMSAGGLSHGDWTEILEVSPNASLVEIRLAHWKKMQELRPERLAELGPELKRLAEQRLREIDAALATAEARFRAGQRRSS